jgi:hypothetical protein
MHSPEWQCISSSSLVPDRALNLQVADAAETMCSFLSKNCRPACSIRVDSVFLGRSTTNCGRWERKLALRLARTVAFIVRFSRECKFMPERIT